MAAPERTCDSAERDRLAWHGCAFGVVVAAEHEIETLSPCAPAPGAEIVTWRRTADEAEVEAQWDAGEEKRLVDFRFDDGRPMMSIDVNAAGAFRIAAPGYGTHVLRPDASSIVSLLPSDATWTWQRLFSAQVLPLTAAARGLEPLHAAGVVVDGRAIALTAASGTGKSSLTQQLLTRGAGLLADDVLALESTPSGLVAHPGTRLLSVAAHELESISANRDRLGEVFGRDDKVYLRAPVVRGPKLLRSVYRLRRRPAGTSFRIVAESPPDPRSLLGTTFLPYLAAPDRLMRHLATVADLAESVDVFAVDLPTGMLPAAAAELLEDHLASTASPASR